MSEAPELTAAQKAVAEEIAADLAEVEKQGKTQATAEDYSSVGDPPPARPAAPRPSTASRRSRTWPNR
ncbi:MAG TPA: hypothetical protein VKM54_26765 [Myxococcota bacterium]|nr:hypothetical protein [Myxococcota bacterium]